MYTSAILAMAVAALTTASPVLFPRAGGPEAIPIPANCTVLNPLPHAQCGVANVSGYRVSDNFTAAHAGYSAYYYTPADGAAASAEFCFEQCYGYGTPAQCKSALFAANVPTPKGYYGSAGGELTSACLFFDDWLSPNDFVPVEAEGEYVNATAAGIYCPPGALRSL